MASGYSQLDPARRDEVAERLRAELLSGDYSLHASPFRARGWATVVVGFSLGGRPDYRSLSAALILKHQPRYYAVSYHSDDGETVVLDAAFEIDADLDYEAFKRVAFGVGFGINGMEFYLFDGTFSWCLATVVDAQLLTGDREFMQAWYPEPGPLQEAIEAYVTWIEEVPVDEPYRRMRDYIALRPGGA